LSGTCRLCAEPLRHVAIDLGATPLANAYLQPEQLDAVEPFYPLRVFLCERCGLVQVGTVVDPRVLFADYAYFSSYSDTLLRQSNAFTDAVTDRLGLMPGDRVIEIASNDGYLLQYFLAKGFDVQGIEPADTVAAAAAKKGIPTLVRFFGSTVANELAAGGRQGRLIVANNVVAHVPDLNDFIAGLKILLSPGGTITLEFHHLLSLVEEGQWDTIYHEHFQYFSLGTARYALARHGLAVVDVESIPAQGGSLRVFVRHEAEAEPPSQAVAEMLAREDAAGLRSLDTYRRYSERIKAVKLELLSFLVSARRARKAVVCYGAAAKGNTLLNYSGIRADLVEYAVDRNPHKQDVFLPGSRIPIHHPDRVRHTKPDYLLILPWNLSAEIMSQMAYIREWGGRFVVPVPELRVYPAPAEAADLAVATTER
jgi:hypothetical protein